VCAKLFSVKRLECDPKNPFSESSVKSNFNPTFAHSTMRVFEGLKDVEKISHPVVTIGTFDGVHLGHQQILRQLITASKEQSGESVLFTFYPHPRMVLNGDHHGLQLIQTQEEKIEKLQRTGLQNLIIFPFSLDFAMLTAYQFLKEILVGRIGARTIIIGYDHQFGNDREGNIDFMRRYASEFGYKVIEIPAETINEMNVSSTKIRQAILDGDLEQANRFLGAPFCLNGKVIQGNQIGRTLHFPTANLHIEDTTKIIPANGVYAVEVVHKGSLFSGMMNIGERPTIVTNKGRTLEVHIFDFEEDLYGQTLTVRLLKRTRSEQIFPNLEALSQQLKKDEAFIRDYFQQLARS
jgi:riboflavin kinase / FMN adenylyltransferase